MPNRTQSYGFIVVAVAVDLLEQFAALKYAAGVLVRVSYSQTLFVLNLVRR